MGTYLGGDVLAPQNYIMSMLSNNRNRFKDELHDLIMCMNNSHIIVYT